MKSSRPVRWILSPSGVVDFLSLKYYPMAPTLSRYLHTGDAEVREYLILLQTMNLATTSHFQDSQRPD